MGRVSSGKASLLKHFSVLPAEVSSRARGGAREAGTRWREDAVRSQQCEASLCHFRSFHFRRVGSGLLV